MVCDTALWSCTQYNWPIWKDKNVMARRRKYYLKNNYLTLRSKSHEGHYVVMHPHTNYHWPISKDKNVMAQTRKYYLKNNYLTLRSKVIVVRNTPSYGHVPTYPHTKYHWPISKDTKVMVRTNFAEKKRKRKKKSD